MRYTLLRNVNNNHIGFSFMRITDVKTILLTGPCTNDPFLSELRKLRSAAFIRIDTDTELSGTGETYAGYFVPEMVPAIVDFFKPVLIGQELDDIEALWKRMYHAGNFWCRVGLGAAVLAGIEAALWDLKGKESGLPVYKLLRERWSNAFIHAGTGRGFPSEHSALPCYATGGPSNYPLDKLESKVSFYCSLGFKGVKLGAGAYIKDQGVEIPDDPHKAADLESKKLDFVREKFGRDLWLMLDAHMGNSSGATWNLETAVAVAKAVESYDLFFLEEPLHYTLPDHYAMLCNETSTPIAGGECLTALCEWKTFADQQSFGIGQPDASFSSGLDQFMQVALLFAKSGRSIATHAWGAGASLMQNIHAGFACPNTCMLEVAPAYGPLHSEVIEDVPTIKAGYMQPPEMPGLGIRLTEETIRKFPFIPGSGEFNSVPGKILTT